MNRRISIPISRQLIKFPITPNMVSLFTLGVGFTAAAFFALGGYWTTLLGAFLCLLASILDGCDGEVARLKLQESDFGCWLETICDYLFYLSLFVGMTIGLWRSTGARAYLACGGLLLFGSIASFLATGWERHRLAAATSRAATENLADPRGESAIESLLVSSAGIWNSSSGAAFSLMRCSCLRSLTS